MASRSARNPTGIHMPRPRIVAMMLEKKVAMPPTATPIAATVPTSILLVGRRCVASAVRRAGRLLRVGGRRRERVAVAASTSSCRPPRRRPSARLATCSSISRTNRLYGAQKAWRTLMGFVDDLA